jgi:hypothetical protein
MPGLLRQVFQQALHEGTAIAAEVLAPFCLRRSRRFLLAAFNLATSAARSAFRTSAAFNAASFFL